MIKQITSLAKLLNVPIKREELAGKLFDELIEMNKDITCLAFLYKNEKKQELWIESKIPLQDKEKEEVIVQSLFTIADPGIKRELLNVNYRIHKDFDISEGRNNLGIPISFPLTSYLAKYKGALIIWGDNKDFVSKYNSVFEALAEMVALKLAFLQQICDYLELQDNLIELAQPIFSSPRFDATLKNILHITSKSMNSEYVTLRLLDENKKFLVLKESLGFSEEFRRAKALVNVGESIVGEVVKEKKTIEVPNIKKDPRYQLFELVGEEKALIASPLIVKEEAIGVIAVYYPIDYELTETVRATFGIICNYAAVAITLARLYEKERGDKVAIVKALIAAIDAKDPYTGEHSKNVAKYTLRIAEALGFSEEDKEWLHLAALLHDIGKIGIKDEILHKKEKLTPEEFEIIKGHPIIGIKILGSIGFPGDVLLAVRWHHERVDGKGYPDALPKEKISLAARIIKVADAFEAMISERPYRAALSIKEAVMELKRASNIQFDAEIVNCLIEILRKEGKLKDLGEEF